MGFYVKYQCQQQAVDIKQTHEASPILSHKGQIKETVPVKATSQYYRHYTGKETVYFVFQQVSSRGELALASRARQERV